jgi:hypothetical protein
MMTRFIGQFWLNGVERGIWRDGVSRVTTQRFSQQRISQMLSTFVKVKASCCPWQEGFSFSTASSSGCFNLDIQYTGSWVIYTAVFGVDASSGDYHFVASVIEMSLRTTS